MSIQRVVRYEIHSDFLIQYMVFDVGASAQARETLSSSLDVIGVTKSEHMGDPYILYFAMG